LGLGLTFRNREKGYKLEQKQKSRTWVESRKTRYSAMDGTKDEVVAVD